MTREKLLTRWQAKAGCMHTQDEADRRWEALAPVLTKQQQGQLQVAWGHHTFVREGRSEIDYVCKQIRESWAA